MQEEFHRDYPNGTGDYKKLYGWGTINTNVWLPSLSELVGITGTEHAAYGCYLSAMQGLNISSKYYTDAKGGAQWAYFQLYNVSGGSQKIWSVSNQEKSWLRSPDLGQSQHVTGILEGGNPSTYILVTGSLAVHPAVLYNPERPEKADLKSVVTVFIMAHIP